jgi:CHAT domain-containing protein
MKNAALQFFDSSKKIVLKLTVGSCLLGLMGFSILASDADSITQKNSFSVTDSPQILIAKIELEKEIRGRETHSYKIEAKTGDCIRLIVRQKGIDVIITVKTPVGKVIAEIDRPNGSFGRETVTFIAEDNGAYLVEVSGYNQDLLANKYTILLEELSQPVESDRRRIVAEKLTTEGESLRFAGERKTDAKLLEEALTKFQEALTIWESLSDFYEQAVIHYGLGWAHIPQGRYDRSTLSFARGLKIAQTLGDEYAQTLDFAGIGWSEFYSGNFETAAFNFNLAVELARKNDYKSQIARSLFGLGNIAYMRGHYDDAFKLLSECVQIRREINERRQENLTLITVAKILIKQKQGAKAIDYLNRTLTFFKESSDKRGEVEAIITLGWAYLSIAENQKGVEHFRRALQIRNNLGDKAGEAAALRGLSVAYARTGDYQNARAEVERMFVKLDSLRGESLSADTRVTFTASIQEYFEDGISILMRMHEREPNQGFDRAAFEFNERSRSRALLDLIQKKQINSEQKTNPRLLAQKQNLQQQLIENLVAESEMRSTEKHSETVKKQRLKIQDLLFLLRETEGEIDLQSSNRGEIFAAPSVPLTEIQEFLEGETVLLEYWLGEEQSYMWMATREKVFSFALPKRETIEKLALGLRDALLLQKSDRINGERAFNENAAKLRDILLAPALPHLKQQRLLIVPQGALSYVPFAALPKNAAPLLLDHEISYLPSASLLLFLQRKNKLLFDKEIAVFADPIFSPGDERLPKVSVSNQDSAQNPQRLFSSRFEANKIATFVPSGDALVALDAEASREKIIKTDLSQYRILHFATHAFIDDERPELSAVMLSNFEKNGGKTNGLLRSAEIINLDLNNEMVVLSGCRTGLGKNVRGEGFLNLSRSFMLAGTSRLLVSLWEVEDKATAELMARFYRKHLKEKMPAAAALRAAQLGIMSDKRWRLPFYWSPFVLQGDWK